MIQNKLKLNRIELVTVPGNDFQIHRLRKSLILTSPSSVNTAAKVSN